MKENVKLTFKILFSILIISFFISFLISISLSEPYSLKFVPHPKGTGTTFEGTLIVPFVLALLIFVYFIISLATRTAVDVSVNKLPFYKIFSNSPTYMGLFGFIYGKKAKDDFKSHPHSFYEKMYASFYITFSLIVMTLLYLSIIFSNLFPNPSTNSGIIFLITFILLFGILIFLSRKIYSLFKNK